MVFSYIASAARVEIHTHQAYCLHTYSGNPDYDACIEMLHEWAPRSYIAKGACEVLWSSGTFTHGWYFKSDLIIDPHAPLFLRTFQGGIELTKRLGISIDLRECVQKIRLCTNPNPYDLAKPTINDIRSLLKLKQELSQLCQFPHLRRVEIEIWIPQQCDAYFQGMTIVERISSACTELRKRIGAGLNVTLFRAWPYDTEKFEYMEYYDISWMWDKPNYTCKERLQESLTTVDGRIRRLLAEGVRPNGEYSLLEELRYAGSFLPQYKYQLVKMEVWNTWTGISESEWQWLKKRWGRDNVGVYTE